MAPALASAAVPSKRSNDTGELGNTKQRRHYHHKHKTNVKQSRDHEAAVVIQDADIIAQQLERGIQLVLEAVGFSHADPVALASFRCLAEEYMGRFLAQVRLSMTSARRLQPVPHDFMSALTRNNLTLRSLELHLNPPVPASKSQPPLESEAMSQDAALQEAQLINKLLTQATLHTEPYVPRFLPALPSRHTFKSEAIYPNPASDPKRIREQATEEGRLGEEALRRLMSKKASGDNTLLTGLRSGSKLSLRQRSHIMWKETYEEALRMDKARRADAMDVDGHLTGPADVSHLGPAVNADSMYWRKPIARKITETVPADS